MRNKAKYWGEWDTRMPWSHNVDSGHLATQIRHIRNKKGFTWWDCKLDCSLRKRVRNKAVKWEQQWSEGDTSMFRSHRVISGHKTPQFGHNLMQNIDLPGGTVRWTVV
jgi:hypothetical protein